MDMTTLILIIAIIALVLFFMNRNRMVSRGPTNYNDPSAGANERPTYDNPDYRRSGSIGGSPSGVEIPRERSVGGLETPTTRSGNSSVSGGSPRNDDPDYRSGGSIGG
jgi:hypothetical protein